MILDLNKFKPHCVINKRADVCIVGAGTAGIYLANTLASKGISIVLVELGGLTNACADVSFKSPSFALDEYKGADLGRVSGLGGTSSKWGGQMISLSPEDFMFRHADDSFAGWPLNSSHLAYYYQKVSETLGISDPKDYAFHEATVSKLIADSSIDKVFKLREASWIPFRKRNFAKGFRAPLKKAKNVSVWLNCSFESTDDLRWNGETVKEAKFQGSDGRVLNISSKTFVLTMGAIESTKHIFSLLYKSNSPPCEINEPFCDHISTSVGKLKLKDKKMFLEHFSPYYVNGVMRSLRFELAGELQINSGLASSFVHFATKHQPGSALDVIRSVARKLQGESISLNLSGFQLWTFFKDLTFILFWRLFKGKLVLNHGDAIEILVDVEQRPDLKNRITYDDKGLKLHWGISEENRHLAKKTSELFQESWNSSAKLASIAEVVLDSVDTDSNYYDVYHPTGSLPFGGNSGNSILDENLCLRGATNLYVSSTAVFPTAGSANPGFTHLALTHRLADHIGSKV